MKSMLTLLLALGSVALVCGGCTSFNGQWLEQASSEPQRRRAAIEFDGISTVWFGRYSNEVGVVDQQSVQSDTYTIFEGGKIAQFGGVLATVDGNTMRTITAGTVERFYTRVKGKSIFPPKADLPKLSKSNQERNAAYANAAP